MDLPTSLPVPKNMTALAIFEIFPENLLFSLHQQTRLFPFLRSKTTLTL